MKIDPSEVLLESKWDIRNGKVSVSDVTKRIDELTASCLIALGSDPSGCETLYVDPCDGRFWEKTYPYGEMHGGGPPQLQCIPRDKAESKYGSDIVNRRSSK